MKILFVNERGRLRMGLVIFLLTIGIVGFNFVEHEVATHQRTAEKLAFK